MTVHSFLGKSHVNVSRSHDLVHFGDGFRAVSQSRDGLSASYLIYVGRSRLVSRHQCRRRHFTVLIRRRHHDDLLHACHLGRHDIHKNRRRIRRFSARHIHAHGSQSRYLLSEDRSVRFGIKPAVLFLFLMIFTDVGEGFANDSYQLVAHLFIGGGDLLLRHLQSLRRQPAAVKLLRVAEQRFVPLRLHSVKNLLHTVRVGVVLIGTSFEQVAQYIFRRLLIYLYNSHCFPPHYYFFFLIPPLTPADPGSACGSAPAPF